MDVSKLNNFRARLGLKIFKTKPDLLNISGANLFAKAEPKENSLIQSTGYFSKMGFTQVTPHKPNQDSVLICSNLTDSYTHLFSICKFRRNTNFLNLGQRAELLFLYTLCFVLFTFILKFCDLSLFQNLPNMLNVLCHNHAGQ